MNILMIIPTFGGGGAQNVLRSHFYELSKEHNVIVCLFNEDVVLNSEIPYVSLGVNSTSNLLSKGINFFKRIKRLKQIKKQYHIDVSISHLEGANFINVLSKSREKVILCVHGSKVQDEDLGFFNKFIQNKLLLSSLYNKADKVVTVSEDIKKELVVNFGIIPAKIEPIHNFFDTNKIKSLSSEPIDQSYLGCIYHNRFSLVNSGRLHVQKNQKSLIDIVSELKDVLPCSLIILGDGLLRDFLAQYSRAKGLRTYVEWEGSALSKEYDVYFLGFQKNPFAFIKKADLFLFPSNWEGFPLALGEAMATGTAVVSSNCPTGPREMLSPNFTSTNNDLDSAHFGEYGVLMPMLKDDDNYQNNIGIWCNLILELAKDRNKLKMLGITAEKRIEDFTKDKIFPKWNTVLFKK